METADQKKPVLRKLKDLFVEIQPPYNSLLSKQRKFRQRGEREVGEEIRKEAEAKQERLKREAKQKAVAAVAAAGLGSSYYGPSSVTTPKNDNAIMSQGYMSESAQWLEQNQIGEKIRRLTEQKYLVRVSKYDRRFSQTKQQLQRITKEIDLTLTPTVQGLFQTYDRAKDTLLAADWRHIRDDLAVNNIMRFCLPSSLDRTIDALEYIQKAEPTPTEVGGEIRLPVKQRARKGKRGRKALQEPEVQRRLNLLHKWERSQNAKIRRACFCSDEKVSIKYLEKCQAWKRGRDRHGRS